MVYLILYIFLLFFSVVEISGSKKLNKLYIFFILAFSVILFFRYGQGIDYFNYMYAIKSSTKAVHDFFTYNLFENRFEILFSLLSYFLIEKLDFSAELVISLISLIAFIPLGLFFRKYSRKPLLSLLYFISFFFFIYPYSGIREGACIAMFACYLLSFLYNTKYLYYYGGVFLLILFHNSAAILLFLPLIRFLKFSKKNTYLLLVISLFLGVIIMPFAIRLIFGQIGEAGKIGAAYLDKGGSGLDFISLALRVFLFFIIDRLYFGKCLYEDKITKFFFQIYVVSLALYLLTVTNSLLSSRLSIYFRLVEPVLIVNVIFLKEFKRKFLAPLLLLYFMSVIMYVKTISTELKLGDYRQELKFYQLPYVTIFNKSDIYHYRRPNSDLRKYLN